MIIPSKRPSKKYESSVDDYISCNSFYENMKRNECGGTEKSALKEKLSLMDRRKIKQYFSHSNQYMRDAVGN